MRENSNTTVSGSIILGVGLGVFLCKNGSLTNWWLPIILGIIVIVIGFTKWGGGK